jgi:hypothetical protein
MVIIPYDFVILKLLYDLTMTVIKMSFNHFGYKPIRYISKEVIVLSDLLQYIFPLNKLLLLLV